MTAPVKPEALQLTTVAAWPRVDEFDLGAAAYLLPVGGYSFAQASATPMALFASLSSALSFLYSVGEKVSSTPLMRHCLNAAERPCPWLSLARSQSAGCVHLPP